LKKLIGKNEHSLTAKRQHNVIKYKLNMKAACEAGGIVSARV